MKSIIKILLKLKLYSKQNYKKGPYKSYTNLFVFAKDYIRHNYKMSNKKNKSFNFSYFCLSRACRFSLVADRAKSINQLV